MMVDSVETHWLRLKIRLIVAGLVCAVGFYCGVTQTVLTGVFWPGVEPLSGLIFFLAGGTLIGLYLPSLLSPVVPTWQREQIQREWHPVALSETLFAILAAMLLVVLLSGALVSQWLTAWVLELPRRFLVDPLFWKAITFTIPAAGAGVVGLLLGLILNLTFRVFVGLECPSHLNSDQPIVQEILLSVSRWVLIALGVGWLTGIFLSRMLIERLFAPVVIPLILCLGVILLCLIETRREHDWFERESSRSLFAGQKLPEFAGSTDRWAGMVVAYLGGVFSWNWIHWTYALSNWMDSRQLSAMELFGVTVFAFLAAGVGMARGYRRTQSKPAQEFSIADRQGIVLMLFGLSQILAAVGIAYIFHAQRLSGPPLFIFLSLIFAGLSGMWGACLGMMVPSLALGRPNRLDLWRAFSGNLAIGVLPASLMVLAGKALEMRNLSAIAFASLITFGIGGMIILYHDRPQPIDKALSRTEKYFRAYPIILLYLGLVFLTLVVPDLSKRWLVSTRYDSVHTEEGRAGVAFMADVPEHELLWANQRSFPERFDPVLRAESERLVGQILTQTVPSRAILLALPYISNQTSPLPPVRQLGQFDIDRSLRSMELKLRGLSSDGPVSDILDFYCLSRPGEVMIAFCPHPWPAKSSWPDPSFLIARLFSLAHRPQDVWILSLRRRSPFIGKDRWEAVERVIGHYAGNHLQRIAIDSRHGDYQWMIWSSSSSAQGFQVDFANP